MRGEWIIARGWNQEKWEKPEFPDKRILNKYFSDTPVCLTRVDGHAAWVNSKALEIAGIDHSTPDPRGGMIIRDSAGYPTGILLDNAMQLVNEHIPEYTLPQVRNMIITAMQDLVSSGFSEVHDMDVPPEYIPVYREIQRDNIMPVRINSYISAQNNEWKKVSVIPEDGEYFSIKGLKFFADGALGSKGAALLEGYRGEPGNKGLLFLSEDEMLEKAAEGLQNGFQIATHAIGDAACRMTLNVYEKLRTAFPYQILRIEHSQIVHPDDIPRYKKLNVTPVIQSTHCISDTAGMAQKNLNETTLAYSYPWRSFLNHSVHFASSSDFPIEPHNPFTGIDGLVRRIPAGRSTSFNPEEIVSLDDAIESYTSRAHEAAGIKSRGRIKPGFDADLTIIDKDPYKVAPEELKNIKIKAVFVKGKLNYKINSNKI